MRDNVRCPRYHQQCCSQRCRPRHRTDHRRALQLYRHRQQTSASPPCHDLGLLQALQRCRPSTPLSALSPHLQRCRPATHRGPSTRRCSAIAFQRPLLSKKLRTTTCQRQAHSGRANPPLPNFAKHSRLERKLPRLSTQSNPPPRSRPHLAPQCKPPPPPNLSTSRLLQQPELSSGHQSRGFPPKGWRAPARVRAMHLPPLPSHRRSRRPLRQSLRGHLRRTHPKRPNRRHHSPKVAQATQRAAGLGFPKATHAETSPGPKKAMTRYHRRQRGCQERTPMGNQLCCQRFRGATPLIPPATHSPSRNQCPQSRHRHQVRRRVRPKGRHRVPSTGLSLLSTMGRCQNQPIPLCLPLRRRRLWC
mmetsp:Transcript_69192/g.155354  ORF Transcript_69192/g.155354 Transcript_69192/m.155354 type:complete len:361 (-) Transcript_69192:1228-2310(-)